MEYTKILITKVSSVHTLCLFFDKLIRVHHRQEKLYNNPHSSISVEPSRRVLCPRELCVRRAFTVLFTYYKSQSSHLVVCCEKSIILCSDGVGMFCSPKETTSS